MDSGGVVDTDHLGRLVARLDGAGVTSIGVLGSTGSYMYLRADERARAIAAAVEAAGQTPVIAGIGAMATCDVVANARAAQNAGAAGVLLAPVQYLPLTDDEIVSLYAEVAEATNLPILIYNAEGKTGISLSEPLMTRLAALDGVDAIKNPAKEGQCADQMARLRACMPEGFVLGYSGDALINDALSAGADAWYSVIAGTLPELARMIWKARAEPARLVDLHSRCAPLWSLFTLYGAIRVVPHILELQGQGQVDLPRPLQRLPRAVIAEIEVALDHLPREQPA